MAQERDLGYASAPERHDDEPSKEELQRRMGEARDSIASTVTEIKETVAQQVEHVKDALDWREHFKKQPVAWSLGALGVGFFAGYGIAAAIKGDEDRADRDDYASASSSAYAAQPILGEPQYSGAVGTAPRANGDQDPSLLQRFKGTSAYERLSKEAGLIGDRLLDELSTTAQTIVLPALLAKVKNWIGLDLSEKRQSQSATATAASSSSTNRTERNTYQPVLERPS
ncbi:MAG: hypothetical protein ACRD6N_01600 [Pyrinomonadaceae bacterium]